MLVIYYPVFISDGAKMAAATSTMGNHLLFVTRREEIIGHAILTEKFVGLDRISEQNSSFRIRF